MIVGVKKNVLYVVKSCHIMSNSGSWLSNEFDSRIYNLQSSGFKVRAVVTDNHSSNVNAFACLLKKYCNTSSNLFINHPAYQNTLKTYLFYDMVHIIKNVRNNLLHHFNLEITSKTFCMPYFMKPLRQQSYRIILKEMTQLLFYNFLINYF